MSKVTGIECPVCRDRIWSRHRHDFRRCRCRYCFVDGGREYLRIGWGGPLTWPNPRGEWPKPEYVEIEMEDKRCMIGATTP